jgi:hypothetical protein
MSSSYAVSLACRVLLGTVFAVSVLSKVRSVGQWRAFSSWVGGLPLRPLRVKAAPGALAVAEAAVVVLVAVPPCAVAGLVAGSVLCLTLTIGLYLAVRAGSHEPCHCFGASSEPLSRRQVVRNALLLAAAVTGAVSAAAGLARMTQPAEVVLTVIAGLAAAIAVIFFDDIAAMFIRAVPAPGAAPVRRVRTEVR